MLLRLSAIPGGFNLDDALVVAADEHHGETDPLGLVISLVAKSLVLSQNDGSGRSFRILETTRAFAAEKQRVSGEADPVRQRNADPPLPQSAARLSTIEGDKARAA